MPSLAALPTRAFTKYEDYARDMDLKIERMIEEIMAAGAGRLRGGVGWTAGVATGVAASVALRALQ